MKKVWVLTVLCLTVLLSGCSIFGRETVYFWNDDPNAQETWQEIARIYEEEKNIRITVVSLDRSTYVEKLTQGLEAGDGPAIFSCGGIRDVERWKAYLLELNETELAKACTGWDAYLMDGDRVLAVGHSKEYIGVLVNKALLKAAGYRVEDLKDFTALQAVTEDITARAEELRFCAFTGGCEDAALLMVNYALRDTTAEDRTQLAKLHAVLDLYALNGSWTGADMALRDPEKAVEEFAEGDAVFLLGNSTLYKELVDAGIRSQDLAMIPLYCDTEEAQSMGLATGTNHYWAVNAQASEEEISLALEFLNWVASSEEAIDLLQQQYGGVPFRTGQETDNPFCLDGQNMEQQGRLAFAWMYNQADMEEGWLEQMVAAMKLYCIDPSEISWTAIEKVYSEK